MSQSPLAQGRVTRRIIARLIVIVVLGIGLGIWYGRDSARDAARGRALTIKEYMADFDTYRKDLIKSEVPTWLAILSMLVALLLVIGVYELLVVAVDKTLEVVDRKRPKFKGEES